ncbi:hypothetical protein RFI_20058, partial [Reticulomyxa filosa]
TVHFSVIASPTYQTGEDYSKQVSEYLLSNNVNLRKSVRYHQCTWKGQIVAIPITHSTLAHDFGHVSIDGNGDRNGMHHHQQGKRDSKKTLANKPMRCHASNILANFYEMKKHFGHGGEHIKGHLKRQMQTIKHWLYIVVVKVDPMSSELTSKSSGAKEVEEEGNDDDDDDDDNDDGDDDEEGEEENHAKSIAKRYFRMLPTVTHFEQVSQGGVCVYICLSNMRHPRILEYCTSPAIMESFFNPRYARRNKLMYHNFNHMSRLPPFLQEINETLLASF